MSLTITTPADGLPVSIEDSKKHCVIEHDDDDSLIKGMISAARELVESEAQIALLTTTLQLEMDSFPQIIELRKPPIQSVTSVRYYDVNGTLQTLDPSLYQVDVASWPARIIPAAGKCWPSTECGRINAILVEFVAGYTSQANVPENVKLAINLLVSHWNEHREAIGKVGDEIELSFHSLLKPVRWTL